MNKRNRRSLTDELKEKIVNLQRLLVKRHQSFGLESLKIQKVLLFSMFI